MFTFTAVRGGSSTGELQLAEIKLYGVGGHELTVLEASNPGGEKPAPWESSASVHDGNLQTKWLDMNITKANGRQIAVLLLSFATPTPVESYDLFTASNPSSRDPVSWTFAIYRPFTNVDEGEQETGRLEVLHTVATLRRESRQPVRPLVPMGHGGAGATRSGPSRDGCGRGGGAATPGGGCECGLCRVRGAGAARGVGEAGGGQNSSNGQR